MKRTTETLGGRLEACRQAQTPVPSFRQLERLLVVRIGDAFTPSSETLRRWHQPTATERDVNIVVLLALADIYDVTLRDLSESGANLLSDLGSDRIGCVSGIAA